MSLQLPVGASQQPSEPPVTGLFFPSFSLYFLHPQPTSHSNLCSFPFRVLFFFSSSFLLLLTLPFLPLFDPSFLLFVTFAPRFPVSWSHPPFLSFFLSPSPSLPPSTHPLSPVIPGSVSASRLSALKLSQRRPVAGRNPALRGNYLPHGLQQHTQTHIHRLLLYTRRSVQTDTKISVQLQAAGLFELLVRTHLSVIACVCVLLYKMSRAVTSTASPLC